MNQSAAVPPVVLSIPYRDPATAFRPLAGGGFALLLDSAAGHETERGRYSYIAVDPLRPILQQGPGPGDVLAVLQTALMAHGRASLPGLPPFQGGAAGVLGYELGGLLERLPPARANDTGWPAMAFALYDTVAAYDHAERRAWVIAHDIDPARRPAKVRAQALATVLDAPTIPTPESPSLRWWAEMDQGAYEARVARAIAYIHAGDIFQANITRRFLARLPEGTTDRAAYGLYERLRGASTAPFGGFLNLGDGRALLSASPERFLRVHPDGLVETRPIKGTRPRGPTPEEDAQMARLLLSSPKDRAENLMIVDLLRNDLSRVCRVGSVETPVLCALESFASVHHLVSVVRGRLRPECGPVALLRAAFPGGSVTGAPKIRAMEVIHELEPAPRGAYCGAMAWIGWDGAMDSAVVIRSVTLGGGRAVAQAGCGIVADSDPETEHQESLTKVRPLLRALAETHFDPHK